MKNKISDLTDHLFAQIERLGDEDLDADGIAREVQRTEAIVKVADQIVANAQLQLKATAIIAQHGVEFRDMMPNLIGKSS